MDHGHYQAGPSNYAVAYPQPPPPPMPPGSPYGTTYQQPYYYANGHMPYPMGNHPQASAPVTNNGHGQGHGYYHNTHPRRPNRGYHNTSHSNQSHMHQQQNRQRSPRTQRYASSQQQQQHQAIPSYPTIYGMAPVPPPPPPLPHQVYAQHIQRSPLMQPVYAEQQLKSPLVAPTPISPAAGGLRFIPPEMTPSPRPVAAAPLLVVEAPPPVQTEPEQLPAQEVDVQTDTLPSEQVQRTPSPSSPIPPSLPATLPSLAPETSAAPEPSSPDQKPYSPKRSFADVTGDLPTEEWVISVKPNPSRAFGITISPNAKAPKHIVDGAVMAFGTASPLPLSPRNLPMPDRSSSSPEKVEKVHDFPSIESLQSEQHSIAETESVTSTMPDTQVATPVSTCTSISANIPKTIVSDGADATNATNADGDHDSTSVNVAVQEVSPALDRLPPSKPETPQTPSAPAVPAVPASPATPPLSAVKKSWASLLRPESNGKSGSSLPTSSVVGFSIPAQQSGPSIKPSLASHSKADELLSLLSKGVPGNRPAPRIRPRGLPFSLLFQELDKYDLRARKDSQKSPAVPLVEATIAFLKEFAPKPQENDDGRDEDEYGGIDSFVPGYVYDALKENKRFDGMRFGQQEDAEEFLGFFIDTLEEELLSIQSSLKPTSQQPKGGPPKSPGKDLRDDGWMEVGKKNKALLTRSIKSADSPITRIFGGKFRSTLKVPGQRDSVLVEDWRALQLDIQREQVSAVEDALRFISHPQPVQVASVTKGGAVVDATQQVQVDLLPPILVLHMKRFLYDTKVNGVVKIGKQISFGPELELPADALSPTLRSTRPIKYKLFAAVYHHGQSAAGGHYTLDVLHPNRNADLSAKPREGWIRIDDELVSDLRPQDIFGGCPDDRCAYLLFYSRIGGTTLYSRA